MDYKRKFNFNDTNDRDQKLRKKNAYKQLCTSKVNSRTTSTSDTDSNPTQEKLVFQKVEEVRKYICLHNLIQDLDEILNEENRTFLSKVISEDAVNNCLSLQTCLLESKKKIIEEAKCDRTATPDSSHELSKLPRMLSPLSLSPWKASSIPSDYPPLPAILDPTLESATFIHCSASAGHKGALNYEQLELIGDAYMELIATLLISQTFPSLSPGKQSQIREMLVKNLTLANYSLQYKFDKRLKMDWTLLKSTSLTKVKVLGDVFEAYVAAVVLSDPILGVERVSQWLKSLWSMTIATTIVQEEKSDYKISSHLWHLRGNIPHEKIAEAFNNRPIQLNAKERLQKLIGGKHAKLSYKEVRPPTKDPNTKLAVFSIGVFLDGWGEENKMLGTGQANGKKEAGLKAAAAALEKEDLIKIYADQKTAQRELELKDV